MPRTVVVSDVTIVFHLHNRADGSTETDSSDFMPNSSMLSEVNDYAAHAVDFRNAGDDGDWECTEWEIDAWDCDYADPRTFTDLDAYGDYIESVEKYGEGFALRYADIGDHNHRDEYIGCYRDEASFVRDNFTQFNDIPDHLENYIDWDAVASDWMANFSTYQGSEGLHVFRD